MRLFNQIVTKTFLICIFFYQKIISPLLPARCRYYPTCSHYGQTAIRWHGPWRGGWLTLRRIFRCHPWGGHGIDFVPLPLYRYRYYAIPQVLETQVVRQGQGFGVFVANNSYYSCLNNFLKK